MPGRRVSETKGRPVIIGVGGPSGSGKTTLTVELARELNGIHFPIDNYYLDLGHLAPEERVHQNFDHPSLIEDDLLVQHVAALRDGKSIDAPLYDFPTHTRRSGVTSRTAPPRVLLVEGNFALHFPALRQLYDWSLYVDAPDHLCYERRLARDVSQRGRSSANIQWQYEHTVRPMAEKFVRPSAAHADLVVDGSLAIDWIVEQVRSALRAYLEGTDSRLR